MKVQDQKPELLLQSPWSDRIKTIEQQLITGLEPCRHYSQVKGVRVLGAIGVVELQHPVNIKKIQPMFVEAGVWIRPFNHLIYLMPPYIINPDELNTLTQSICTIVSNIQEQQ